MIDRSFPLFRRCWVTLLLLGVFASTSFGEVRREVWGKTDGGEPIEIFTFTNEAGLRARVMTWGATLVEMSAPDRAGWRT